MKHILSQSLGSEVVRLASIVAQVTFNFTMTTNTKRAQYLHLSFVILDGMIPYGC
jgi:hypothetical protein